MNDKREGKRGKKKIWVAILPGRKNGILMKKTEKYDDFSSMIVKMLQPKETFSVS